VPGQTTSAATPSADAARHEPAHPAYRPDIDGIRAIAIGSVMLFHAGIPGMSGGFAGVDVFFVISGFLIASQILREIDAGTFSMTGFWTRRTRRIVPAMATMMAATLAAGWFAMFASNYADLGRAAVAQALFGSNFYFWIKAGYFAGPSELKPLLHTWSLAVEEQYYLVIPFLLWLTARRGRFVAGVAIGALLAASLVWSVMTTRGDADFAFYLLPSRGWELLAGCGLALLPPRVAGHQCARGGVAQVAGAAGLSMVVLSFVAFDAFTPWPAPAAVLPCAGTLLLLWSGGRASTMTRRLLGARPMVAIGLLSYSLYLWHWPVLAFARYLAIEPLGPWEAAAAMAASVPVAYASYRLVETPCRRGAAFGTPARALGISGAMMVAVLAGGAIVMATDGRAGRARERAEGFESARTAEKLRQELCAPITSIPVPPAGFCRLGDVSTAQPKLLLVGDSFSGMYLGSLARGSAATGREVWFCRDRVVDVHPAVVDAVRAGPVTDVVLAYSWRRAMRGGIPEIGARGDGAARTYDASILLQDRAGRFTADVLALVRELRSLGARVHVVDAPPDFAVPVPLKLAMIVRRGGDPSTLRADLAEHRRSLAPVHAVFDELERAGDVTLVRPTEALCGPDGTCPAWREGHALYSDDSHLSEEGAALVDPLFLPALRGQ